MYNSRVVVTGLSIANQPLIKPPESILPSRVGSILPARALAKRRAAFRVRSMVAPEAPNWQFE